MRVPLAVIPVLIVCAAVIGIGAGRFAVLPSFERDFPGAPAGIVPERKAVLIVRGMKCLDTAKRAAAQLEGIRGVSRFVAYAAANKAEITFDPAVTNTSALVEAIEGPVYDPGTGEIAFHVFTVIELDGRTLK